jgi:hypothetical protein
LATEDLHRLRVPLSVLDDAKAIGAAYVNGLTNYEPVTRRVRRRLCSAQETTTAILLRGAKLNPEAQHLLEGLRSETALIDFLARLRPNMF